MNGNGFVGWINTIVPALLSVALYSVLYPPVGWRWLAWVALVPWLVCVLTMPLRRQLAISTVAGMAFFAVNVYWIAPITIPGYVSMCVLFGLFWPLAGWAIYRLVTMYRWPVFLAVPVVWTGLEHLRSWVVTGFPWFFLGHSQARSLAVIQIADLVGVYGVTFVVAMVNGLAAEVLCQGWSRRWRRRAVFTGVGVTVVTVGGTLGYGTFRLGQDTVTAGPMVAVVQEDFPLTVERGGIAWDRSLSAHLRLSEKAGQDGPALIVWPETTVAVPVNPEFLTARVDKDMRGLQGASRFVHDRLGDHARRAKAHLIVGSISYQMNPPGHYPAVDKFNSAVIFDPQGRVTDRYDKIHLVLFGEFVPFRYTLPTVYRFLNERMTPYGRGGFEYSLTAGTLRKRFELPVGQDRYRYSVAICYEDTMPYLMREFVGATKRGKQIDFLVNISNDGWFDHSSELPQHLEICAFRAVENRIGIARSVNTGISAFIDPTGKIEATVGRGTYGPGIRGFLTRAVKVDRRVSFYSRYGDWFAIGCFWITLGAAIVPRKLWRRLAGEKSSRSDV